MTHDDNDTRRLPQPLIDQLRAHDRPVRLITSRTDREVLQRARDQFAGRRRTRDKRPVWVAIAATVLIALFATQFRMPGTGVEQPIYADQDGSGQIDIADVLFLARSADAEKLTQADIDAFALRIVSLAPAGDSS